MDEAPLAERARETGLDGANQARRPVGHGEQRVGQAAAFEILEERRAARRVLLRARRQVQQDLAAVLGDPPGAEHRLARHPRVQAFGHAVDEEVGDRELAEVPPGEGLVFLPQPLGHLADGGPTQHARAPRVTKGRFDVSRAQPARVHLDGQLLQLRRPPGQAGAHPRDKRLGAIGHLRHAVVDRALRGAQPSAPVAVAVAGARAGAALVVAAPHGLGHLGFQRFLDDLPDRQLNQFAPRVALGDALHQQLVELLACPLRGRYSGLHGDASSCRRRQPASLGFESKQECIPVSLSSKSRTSPARPLESCRRK